MEEELLQYGALNGIMPLVAFLGCFFKRKMKVTFKSTVSLF